MASSHIGAWHLAHLGWASLPTPSGLDSPYGNQNIPKTYGEDARCSEASAPELTHHFQHILLVKARARPAQVPWMGKQSHLLMGESANFAAMIFNLVQERSRWLEYSCSSSGNKQPYLSTINDKIC